MRLFGRHKPDRIDEEEHAELLALPYASGLGWDVARIRRVRNLEQRGAEFIVRRPAYGNQAVVSLASFPSELELADVVGEVGVGGIYTICEGGRVLGTYRLAGSESPMGTSRQRGAGAVRSFRHRFDEILADRLEDALDADPDLAREMIEAAVRSHFHLPMPVAVDRWDELAMEVVKDNPAYQDQLVKAYLRKQGIEVDKPTADPLDEFIEQIIKTNQIRELLGGERGDSSSLGLVLLEAVRAVVDTLNSGQLLDLVRAVQLLRTQAPPSDQASGPPHDEPPAPDEAPVADTSDAAPDPRPEFPPKEPAPNETTKTDIPVQPRSSDLTAEGIDLLEAASSVNWQELLQEVRDGPATFVERAYQVALEAPETALGRVFRTVRDNDTPTVVGVLRQARTFLLEDPFRATIIKDQGQAGFDAAMQISNFFSTDAGVQWLAGARQMALGLGIDDGEDGREGHEGVGGGSERPIFEEGQTK